MARNLPSASTRPRLSFNLRVGLLFGLHITALSLFAVYRFVDWDEGFYLQAGRSIADGLLIYTDFFHPQAPLYPHILALLPGVGWDNWLQARWLSVFFSALTMALVGLSVKSMFAFTHDSRDSDYQQNCQLAILLALALYSFSGWFLAWNSVAKPLSLSQFLLMAGVFARLQAQGKESALRAFWFILSGVSLAFAVQTRSPMLVAWVVTFVSVFFGLQEKKRVSKAISNAMLFLLGSAIAALPSMAMALNDGPRFFFNNFGFHMVRTESPDFAALLSDKLNFIARTVFDPQFAIVLFLAALILLRARTKQPYKNNKQTRANFLSYYPLAVGGLIIGSFFMAFPSHRHYVTQGLPVLLVFIGAHSDSVLSWLKQSRPIIRKSAATILTVGYLLGTAPYFWIYFTGPRVRDQRSMIPRISEIVSVIERRSTPQDTILCESPIYAVLSNRQQAPRAEFVGFEYRSLALGERFKEMNLLDSNYINQLITSQRVKLVVVENTPDGALAVALPGKYQKIYEDEFNQIWQISPK